MKKVILKMQISLDGVVSGEGEWMSFSDSIVLDALEYYKTLDTIIVGSRFYSFLSNYWQTAEKASNSPIEKTFAKSINQIDKIVPSRSPIELTWRNSQHLDFKNTANLIREIQEIKTKPGKDISVESGIGMWKLFLDNSIFDEILLYVHPIILGDGVKLFDNKNTWTLLKLRESKALDRGVVKLHYEKQG